MEIGGAVRAACPGARASHALRRRLPEPDLLPCGPGLGAQLYPTFPSLTLPSSAEFGALQDYLFAGTSPVKLGFFVPITWTTTKEPHSNFRAFFQRNLSRIKTGSNCTLALR